MIWGCMGMQGVGYSCHIEGSMTTDLYLGILEDELLKTLKYYKIKRKDIIFQQDNASIHTSPRVTKWLENHKIEVLQWPAQSPDLNPIEHLWYHLKKQLAKYEKEPKGIHELWEHIQVEWNRIPREVCDNLIASMPKRIKALWKVKGEHIPY